MTVKNIGAIDGKWLNITTLKCDIASMHTHSNYLVLFIKIFYRKKNKKKHAQQIRNISTSLTCTSLQENNYSMNIDIHVGDGGGLNIDALHHTIWLSFVSWEKGYFKKPEMDNELQIFP